MELTPFQFQFRNEECRFSMVAKSPTRSGQSGEREAPFGFDELFFSRTDIQGNIKSGNAVFQRVSQYQWSELLDKPHNVIRHQDMPRGVFWLLWDRIRKGLPTGAYVKNQSKDGSYYWVYAIMTPVKDGYLSVRLKPSTALFSAVQEEYQNLLQAERDDGELTPAQSADMLLARLKTLGFRDYQAFMTQALISEMRARDKMLSVETEPTVKFFHELLLESDKLLETAARVADTYHGFRFVPLNLIIQAGQLGTNGAAIGTISNNYSLVAEEIRVALGGFYEAARQVSDTICEGAFLLSTSVMQEEIASAFAKEAKTSEIDHTSEALQLDRQRAHFAAKALENLVDIQRELVGFARGTAEIKRMTSGLAAIRIMGKVEAGRLSNSVLNDLISDLESFQHTLSGGLTEILTLNAAMWQHADQLANACGTEAVSIAA